MSAPAGAAAPKPRLAMLLATACGLGYLPIAPGSWGALGGVLLSILCANFWVLLLMLTVVLPAKALPFVASPGASAVALTVFFYAPFVIVLFAVAAVGVWASERAERYLGRTDPRSVVIDEVSGQLIAYLGALDWTRVAHALHAHPAPLLPQAFLAPELANWKYLLAGFILFRGFDTWKPFPANRAEHFPGGWGVMADDWIAGIYAALALAIARWLGF
jgi:phosphatidylglycerophosphatase A